MCVLESKQLYFFRGSVYPSDESSRKRHYADAVKELYDPFVELLSKGLNTRGKAIQDYGLTLGYFAPLIAEDPRTHNVWDELTFEILGTRDALLYIFPGGKNLLFDEQYVVTTRNVQPMDISGRSEEHEYSLRDLQEWMRDIHAENLRRIALGYCDGD